MVTNGITYGVTSIQSESVSYTKKDGKLTTVKSALDELINTSLTKIDELQEKVTDYETGINYLADVAQIGDYVDYDAGTWNETKDKPSDSTPGEFGGYTAGESRGTSVACYGTTIPPYRGWRVLKVDESSKTVTVIHAGIPECYYFHHGNGNSNDLKKLNDRGKQYVDPKYAETGRSVIDTDVKFDKTNDLRTIKVYYWLATDAGGESMFSVTSVGDTINHNGSYVFGYRPVIVLKSKILTTGIGTDEFGQQAWTLVAKK